MGAGAGCGPNRGWVNGLWGWGGYAVGEFLPLSMGGWGVQRPAINAHAFVGEIRPFFAKRSFFKPEGQNYITVPTYSKLRANQSYPPSPLRKHGLV